jgi:hypothetical protein
VCAQQINVEREKRGHVWPHTIAGPAICQLRIRRKGVRSIVLSASGAARLQTKQRQAGSDAGAAAARIRRVASAQTRLSIA